MKYAILKNNQTIPLTSIPELDYNSFRETIVLSLMKESQYHCVNYFGFPHKNKIKLICCIANDELNSINISSYIVDAKQPLPSFSKHNLVFEKFEREIHENFGIAYTDHPWLKPVRYPFNRVDKNSTVAGYPFFAIESEELHEVGVGPIHAGIIEPGHFRFICNGEQILHLEIQLGYQHRGIEQLFIEKKKLIQRATLAENITGDTVVGHGTTFAHIWESLCGFEAAGDIEFSRTLALELERIAIHVSDLSGACTDIAYQLGSSVFGRLRTPIVNFLQEWGGNRLAKGIIRPGRNKFPFTQALADRLTQVLDKFEPEYNEMVNKLFILPSALSRFEHTGIVSNSDAISIGAVGMTARMTNLNRDIRSSHPYSLYPGLNHTPILKRHGDVYSRIQIRREEIKQSLAYIRTLISNVPEITSKELVLNAPAPNSW